MDRLFFLGCLLFLSWLPASSFAVSISDSAFDRFLLQTTGVGQQTVSFGGSGVPVVSPASANLAVESGALTATRSGTISTPSGARVGLTAKGVVSASAVGALAMKALPYVSYLGAGVALYEFFKSLGYDTEKNPDGSTSVSTITHTWFNNYQQGANQYTSATAACRALGFSGATTIVTGGDYPFSAQCDGGPGYFAFVPNGAQPVKAPSSVQSLADAIAAQSGWPSSSTVAEAVKQAQEVTKETIKAEPSTVTGPAETPSTTKESVKTNPDGSTETTKTTEKDKLSYSGPKVTTQTETQTETKTCTVAGACSTSTSTTTSTPAPVEDYSATDTPFGPIPELYKPKYPDGIEGVWRDRKAELTASPLLQIVPLLMPNIGTGGGTCPNWSLDLDLGPWNFGTHNVAPACWLWDVAKAIVILSALLLARALVFGA